ncbi:hypothetical protein RD792_006061 [Penstemon davidsonii]|uniref:Uncharacterized protein n=1 Tax=Penstemon davidsonii TaxID=160366 RepID=A0ABR0DDM1_9LAMI|nr:hypothetical protein RD792_011888 [Penstemon davidsonii]KAK4487327.1 hypothetical protein RD792_006061 [Penstemon davidsonii]
MGYATSSAMKVICFLMFVLVVTTSSQSQNTRCPFDLLYHLGDGVFDNGNAVANMQHGSRLPAANIPYGNTHPGKPTGRWSDGLLDIDYGAQGLGFQEITAYLSENSSSANAIMFAVARSPVLDRSFFTSRGIIIPSYTVSLSVQMSWFKKYLNTICSTPTDRANKLSNALFLFGDVEANDITYSLIQRKSVQEVRSYIPHVTRAQINAAREVIKMGATRIILPGNAPMGCYPFILTELSSTNLADYDDMGCLKSVNDLIKLKNDDLQQAIDGLRNEFPNTFIMYADFYNSEILLIRKNDKVALQTCCGIGGKYNYDNKRFCGSPGVPICSNPNQYFFWDGIHLTQEANNRLSTALQEATLATLNCTVS